MADGASSGGAVSRLPAPLRGLRASFVFLTRIPVGGSPYRSEDFRWAAAHAPFVGLVVGGLCAVVFVLLRGAGDLPAAAVALGVSLLLTGAFHEDGLADTADALGGAYQRERVLEILKDSRVGSFGACAVGFSLLSRTLLLAELGSSAWFALPLAFALARTGPIWLMALLPYVTEDARSKSRDISRGGFAQALVASLWCLLAALAVERLGFIEWLALALLLGAVALVAALCGWRYQRRVGGITGDFLGATEQLGEVAALLVLCHAL